MATKFLHFDPEFLDPNYDKVRDMLTRARFVWPETIDDMYSEIRTDLIEAVLPTIPLNLRPQIDKMWPPQ